MILASGVSVRRGRALILDGVSLEAARGEVVALVGPSGAGKSTLLRLLAGDARPSTGTVTLDDRPLGRIAPRALAVGRAVLPQESSLSFPFTALEVARLGRAPHGDGASSGGERIARDALVEVGLGGLAARVYPTLSGGERQRVQLARVLAQLHGTSPAAHLLLDEPTASLDLGFQRQVLALVASRARAGHGVVVVLHDLTLAARFADRVVLLRGGRVVAAGPPAEVLVPERLDPVFACRTAVVTVDGHPAIVAVG